MFYKKIVIRSSGGYMTPFESDTILGYLAYFAYATSNNQMMEIFDRMKSEPVCAISNGMIDGWVPRPFIKATKRHELSTLMDDLKGEIVRKSKNKFSLIPMKKIYLEKIIKEDAEIVNELYKEYVSYFGKKEKFLIDHIDYKSSVPRGSDLETTPYALSQVVYTNHNISLFIRSMSQDVVELMSTFMKQILSTYGRGKGRSRGCGEVEVEIYDISHNEEEFLHELERMRKDEGKWFVMNNYKPTIAEIDTRNIDESMIYTHTKNTKTTNSHVFKGDMSFVHAGSIIVASSGLEGGYYCDTHGDNPSFNWGYIF